MRRLLYVVVAVLVALGAVAIYVGTRGHSSATSHSGPTPCPSHAPEGCAALMATDWGVPTSHIPVVHVVPGLVLTSAFTDAPTLQPRRTAAFFFQFDTRSPTPAHISLTVAPPSSATSIRSLRRRGSFVTLSGNRFYGARGLGGGGCNSFLTDGHYDYTVQTVDEQRHLAKPGSPVCELSARLLDHVTRGR